MIIAVNHCYGESLLSPVIWRVSDDTQVLGSNCKSGIVMQLGALEVADHQGHWTLMDKSHLLDSLMATSWYLHSTYIVYPTTVYLPHLFAPMTTGAQTDPSLSL